MTALPRIIVKRSMSTDIVLFVGFEIYQCSRQRTCSRGRGRGWGPKDGPGLAAGDPSNFSYQLSQYNASYTGPIKRGFAAKIFIVFNDLT